MTRSRQAALLLVVAGLTGAAWPVSANPLEACIACHTAPAPQATPAIVAPVLGGQPVAYLTTQMYLFRERLRKPEWMGDFLQGWTDEDLQAAAEQLAKLPKPVPPPLTPEQQSAQVQQRERFQTLSAQHRCSFCHGAGWQGQDNVPALAGQHEAYLLSSLRAYKDNTRAGYDGTMAEVVHDLSDTDLQELAFSIAHAGSP